VPPVTVGRVFQSADIATGLPSDEQLGHQGLAETTRGLYASVSNGEARFLSHNLRQCSRVMSYVKGLPNSTQIS